jgi:phosphatidylserine synthase 2
MFASITFEAVEYSLRNVLNNFKECWWDHLILDFSVFNFIGIICGFIVLDLLGWERYRWSLRRSTSSSLWLSFKSFWSRLDLSEL